MDTTAAISANELADAAFGSDPGRWPLPAATGAEALWLRAVAAGGQGRYACAIVDLDRLARTPRPAAISSMMLSTRASFLRQLGWHDLARAWDGRAAAAADTAEAAGDALVGLAADALGVGRYDASERALERAAESVGAAGSPRQEVRLAWVSAELAMFLGNGATAVGHAERAVRLAADVVSVRHRVKSQIVLAAALCSSGDLAAARREGDAALADTQRYGLVPLQWAIASMLADIGSETRPEAEIRAVRDGCAQTVVRWGGVWRPR